MSFTEPMKDNIRTEVQGNVFHNADEGQNKTQM
ncbi:hypothetical protein SAMN05421676_101161 [Salinibacillus kushneri]|uniref:Uncharacterized protein n=1 Tax=Salinibacillus kushneri TaxID=237682 RepID=A0A1H9YGK1_9BACI|nr:hypothetical protein SAMN05421676_101161 [Salinibacillus kushneri]